MSRIARRFAQLRRAGRGALIPFVEAYDPDRATSMAMLAGLPVAGADLIEIGVPFTDPMADGPTIQAAGKRALAAGATLSGALGMVRDFRGTERDTPIVLMGYLNPILAYGPERFCADAARAGVDGLIVVDLPSEEADLLAGAAEANGLDIIRLIAPTTDDARMEQVLRGSSGFIYYVSITGITGTRTASADELAAAIPRIRRVSDLPIAVGFGVRTPEQAAAVVRVADAAVVASALIDTLAANLDSSGRAVPEAVRRVLDQVRALADGVRGARVDWRNLETFAFGDSPGLADELARLVIEGRKRATCWPVAQGKLTELGKRMVMLDGSGRPRAVLETVELARRRFGEVDACFAHDEGEGDRTLEYWRQAHRAYFGRRREFSDDMMLWCERFRLVEIIKEVDET